MPYINVKCDRCGHVKQDVFTLTFPAPETGEDACVVEYCPECGEKHGAWIKMLSGPAANMNRAWQRQCR